MSTRLATFAIACAALILNGCTLIGFGIGASRGPRTFEAGEIPKLEEGSRVTVYGANGPLHSGQYRGLRERSPEEVAGWYTTPSPTRDSTGTPVWGSRVVYVSEQGRRIHGAFSGFGIKPLSASGYMKRGEYPYMKLRTESGRSTDVDLSTLRYASDSLGRAYEVNEWRHLITSRRIPLLTALALDTAEGEVLIPLEQIAYVDKAGKRKARYKGMAIGFLVDVGVVAAVASALNDALE